MTKTWGLDSLTQMSVEDVLDYIEEHDITVKPMSTDEPALDGIFQFTSTTGFSTFDLHMTEDQAKYAAVLFCRLVDEHNVDFSSAEGLAAAYATSYKVMQSEEMTEEEHEEIRRLFLSCLSSIDAQESGEGSE